MTATQVSPGVAGLYKASHGRVTLLEVPELLFAATDGHGAPASPAFGGAIKALYSMAYGVRFALRDAGAGKMSPLEAQWWTSDPARDFAAALAAGGFTGADMDQWSWRAMIRLPATAKGDVAERVRREAAQRHPELAAALAAVRIQPWREGLAAQTLHVGPYATELPTVRFLHDFIAEQGYRPTGHHHEIYLGDPRRCAPERLRTILRQPVAREP